MGASAGDVEEWTSLTSVGTSYWWTSGGVGEIAVIRNQDRWYAISLSVGTHFQPRCSTKFFSRHVSVRSTFPLRPLCVVYGLGHSTPQESNEKHWKVFTRIKVGVLYRWIFVFHSHC